MHRSSKSGRRTTAVMLGVAAMAFSITACKDLLDVKNPNRVVEDDLSNPASAAAQAAGLGHSVTRALTAILAPYGAATDELQYVGSRDSYDQLDKGFVALPSNEFVDASIPYMAEARFLADATIKRLEKFRADGQLPQPINLVRSYLYGAVIYSAIPDMMDDWVITTVDETGRKTAKPSIGNANMTVMYDSAIAFTTRALAIPDINTAANAALRAQVYAARARAKYAKLLYAKTPRGGTWATGPTTAALVANGTGAADYVSDANAALAAGTGDWRLVLTPTAQNTGFPIIGNDLNNRLELRAGDAYVISNSTRRVIDIRLMDPVNNIKDPAVQRAINSCCIQAVGNYAALTVVSAREMHLLVAEAALAAGNLAQFQASINAVRAFESALSPWTPASTVTALEILHHSRRVNLYNQGKRLRDMYRFGFKDPQWLSTSPAFRVSGCMLALTQVERDPNPNVAPAFPACQA
jgi:starch-binding outer membrane protein, SusD/RagB family